jgi:hypothetical protein
LAPEKNYASIFKPMNFLAERKLEYSAGKHSRYTPKFLPAGQSTLLADNDFMILPITSQGGGFLRIYCPVQVEHDAVDLHCGGLLRLRPLRKGLDSLLDPQKHKKAD